jgi:putative transposase
MNFFSSCAALRHSERLWGRHFWARGYFCVTSGELTKEMIVDYLAHHFEKDPNDQFDIE